MRTTSPNALKLEAGELEEATLLPGSESTASSTVPSGASTSTEHSAQQQVGDIASSASVSTTTASATPLIHNGESDADEVEPIAPPATQPASLARRREGCYVSGGLPPMPVPSAWMRYNGSSASLLQRATIDAHTLYSVFPTWKQQPHFWLIQYRVERHKLGRCPDDPNVVVVDLPPSREVRDIAPRVPPVSHFLPRIPSMVYDLRSHMISKMIVRSPHDRQLLGAENLDLRPLLSLRDASVTPNRFHLRVLMRSHGVHFRARDQLLAATLLATSTPKPPTPVTPRRYLPLPVMRITIVDRKMMFLLPMTAKAASSAFRICPAVTVMRFCLRPFISLFLPLKYRDQWIPGYRSRNRHASLAIAPWSSARIARISIAEMDAELLFRHFSKPRNFLFPSGPGPRRVPRNGLWSPNLITMDQIDSLYDQTP